MGRHVAGDAPEMDRLVDEACSGIGRDVGSLRIPRLAGVVLGGGYGRGEGGVMFADWGTGKNACRLSNDLDFFAITEDGVPEAETVAAVGEALKPVSENWTEKLGVDVDFAVKTPWRLRHDQERVMVQELVHGYFDVCGEKGEALFAGIERLEPSAFPWMEAARLLMNRGMGLLLARERGMGDGDRGTADFVARNINKCILGAGDAILVSRGLYRWRAEDRAAAFAANGGDGLYARAVEWKFRPGAEPVCDWESARERWLDAWAKVYAVGDGDFGRSLRNAARWLARRRTLGEVWTFGQDPVVRVLRGVGRCVRERRHLPPSLRRDWEIFN